MTGIYNDVLRQMRDLLPDVPSMRAAYSEDSCAAEGEKDLILQTGPILGAYITRGWNSYLRKWRRKYRCRIVHRELTDHSILQYEFLNSKEEALD